MFSRYASILFCFLYSLICSLLVEFSDIKSTNFLSSGSSNRAASNGIILPIELITVWLLSAELSR